MKKTFLIIIVLLLSISAYAQDSDKSKQQAQKDSLELFFLSRISQHTAPCYKLYPTQNTWTFLELETYSGRIWQVQYSVNGSEYHFKTVLNSYSLLPLFEGEENIFAGRFELYPTQNIYNFILLDTLTGSTWQVQWSTEAENRGIMKIS